MNKVLFILTNLLIATFVYGQDHPKTLLWKVTKKGNKNESYLFGTFHEVSPSFFNSLSNAVDKLNQSSILFIEERSETREKIALQEQPAWDSKKWKAILTSEQEKVFTAFVHKAEDTSYYNLNSLLLLLTTARLYLMNFCETDTGYAELMDSYIEKLALKKNKLVYSLDINQSKLLQNTAENFSTTQDSLYAVYSIRYMKSMLDSDLTACEIVTAYRNFDINYELDTDLKQNAADKPLLIDRNNHWTLILDRAFSSGNCFVAVGIRHLFYRQGLIQQLRKIGYDVTPIPARL